MTNMIRLRPTEGARVRKPDGELLAATGEKVANDTYFKRLLAAGDVERVPTSKPRAAAQTTATTVDTGATAAEGSTEA